MITDRIALYIVGAGLALAIGAATVQTLRLHSSEIALAAEKLARQTDSTLAAQATANAVSAALAKYQARTREIQEIADAATAQSARDREDAAAAGRAAVGLRQRAAALAASCGAAGRDPAAPSGSPATSSPGDLLADVLGRLDAAGRQLATVADERGTAGLACERSADALRSPGP